MANLLFINGLNNETHKEFLRRDKPPTMFEECMALVKHFTLAVETKETGNATGNRMYMVKQDGGANRGGKGVVEKDKFQSNNAKNEKLDKGDANKEPNSKKSKHHLVEVKSFKCGNMGYYARDCPIGNTPKAEVIPEKKIDSCCANAVAAPEIVNSRVIVTSPSALCL